MWNRLLRVFRQRRRRARGVQVDARTAVARDRFWAQVREGQDEAEAASIPRPIVPAAEG